MAKTPQIIVNGEVLRWAREQRGLSLEVAAKRLSLPADRLLKIEQGLESPTVAKLRLMSEKYKRPLIVLLLDEVPTTFTPLKDFRSLDEEVDSSFSPELLDEIRRATDQQEIYSELTSALGEPVDRPQLPSAQSSAELGRTLRDYLDLDEAALRLATKPDDLFNIWRSAVEAKGILVLQASRVKLGEARGFSLSERLPLVVVLNGQDAPRGKIFTLLHEMAHLALRDSGVCDLHARARSTSDLEIYCNEAAGEALLPTPQLLASPVVASHPSGTPWSDEELDAIQRAGAGASKEVVLRRLLTLGRASQAEYEAKRDSYLEAYEEWRRNRNKASKGGPPPHRMQLRDRGRLFVRSAFDAHADGHVTLSELTDLVGVRTKHLRKLQEEAYS